FVDLHRRGGLERLPHARRRARIGGRRVGARRAFGPKFQGTEDAHYFLPGTLMSHGRPLSPSTTAPLRVRNSYTFSLIGTGTALRKAYGEPSGLTGRTLSAPIPSRCALATPFMNAAAVSPSGNTNQLSPQRPRPPSHCPSLCRRM